MSPTRKELADLVNATLNLVVASIIGTLWGYGYEGGAVALFSLLIIVALDNITAGVRRRR